VDVVIWGAKGHAKVLAELFSLTRRRVVALFDNDPEACSPLPGVPLAIGFEGFSKWLSERREAETQFAIAIGGGRGAERLQIAGCLLECGLTPAEAIHPTAYVSPTARLGRGCQVLAHAVVGVDAELAEQCILNTGAVVDHECRLGAAVHVGPAAALAGCVSVGDCAFIGTNATVLPRINIGRRATVGAGSVVTRDVAEGQVVYGAPAKQRGKMA
jgi:sugar O-acyltransferase (sialic acid O-acetyltransferase NeuD family)